MKKITLLLADDHTVVREGLRNLLEVEGGFEIIAEAADGLEAVAMAQQLQPAVVIMDLAMPQLNGIEAVRRILQQPEPPKVIILSAHSDDVYIEQVASLGVDGFLIKQNSAHMLAKAIREVNKGNTYYSLAITKRFIEHQDEVANQPSNRNPALPHLTTREREVLQLIAEGRSNKQVASDLEISIKTVEKHRQNLMDKLDLHDTASLTRYAIAAGIIESSVQSTII